jgi:AraC-like DNA-binding protein
VEQVDVLIRAAGATLLLMLSLLLVRGAPGQRTTWLLLLFALGLCGFLAGNTPDEGLKLSGAPASLARLLSGNAAIFLWWFALATFDDEFRFGPSERTVGAAWFVLSLLDRGLLPFAPNLDLTWILIPMAGAIVLHLAYRLLADRDGDLVETRRRSRTLLVAVLGMLLLVDVGADIALGVEWKPQGFTIAQNGVILLVTWQLALWLLRVDPSLLTFRTAAANAAPAADGGFGLFPTAASGPGAQLLPRLQELMEVERIYRDPDLTFAQFVARMGAPEAEVRRLVNQQLGHRHFRSFLNAHRIAEARRILADPARAGEKMVAIAFDVGFASLASFNRAFKLSEGKPPSEIRAELLSSGEAASEMRAGGPNRDLRLETGF